MESLECSNALAKQVHRMELMGRVGIVERRQRGESTCLVSRCSVGVSDVVSLNATIFFLSITSGNPANIRICMTLRGFRKRA
jgi:hypothetical protein